MKFRFPMLVLACLPLLPLMISEEAAAAEWSVPLAGNAYRTSPAPGNQGFQSSGTIVLSRPAEVFSVYVHVDRPADLQLAVRASSHEDQSTLVTSVSDTTHRSVIAGEKFSVQPIGDVQIRQAGYVKIDLQLAADSQSPPLEVQDLLITSATDQLSLNYVSTSKGNMFYWGRRGPSVHLRYDVPADQPLQYAYCEVTVPAGQDPIGSFFMANGFPEGYFGFQVNSSAERRVLFSVWSPARTDRPEDVPADQRITLLAQGPAVHVGEFGNEGSGGQSYLVYPWQTGKTYRFLTEVHPDGQGSTVYTSWFGDKAADEWRLIASFRRPQTDTHLRGFHSFLESFLPAFGHLQRRAEYAQVWVRDIHGTWHECTRARFSVDATGAEGHRLDFSGGTADQSFFLQNCGFFSETGQPGTTLTRKSSGSPPPPVNVDGLPRN